MSIIMGRKTNLKANCIIFIILKNIQIMFYHQDHYFPLFLADNGGGGGVVINNQTDHQC